MTASATRPAPERVFGTSLLRLLMRLRLGQPISDGTSGMYAVNQLARSGLLSDPYVCEAPEVEALDADHRRQAAAARGPRCTCASASTASRRSGGRRAVELVVGIGLTLFATQVARRRYQRASA